MELSRKDALNIMNAFHACCVLERDLAVAMPPSTSTRKVSTTRRA